MCHTLIPDVDICRQLVSPTHFGTDPTLLGAYVDLGT